MSLWLCVLNMVIGGFIDWSGVGQNAYRDRVAAIFYLAAILGLFENIGIAAWEVQMHHSLSPDWRIIWSMISVVPVLFWIGAMVPALPVLGRFGRMSFRGGRTGGVMRSGGDGPSSQDRINGKLLGWTVGVALATPLAMPSAYAKILASINDSATGAALAVATSIARFFGWI